MRGGNLRSVAAPTRPSGRALALGGVVDSVQAAFLIVPHAVHDTAFMRAMLPAVGEAYRRGELDGGAVALLPDRLEVKAGRRQVYGTQLSLEDGRWVLDPIAAIRVEGLAAISPRSLGSATSHHASGHHDGPAFRGASSVRSRGT